jgi:hypothetical protein
VKYPIILPFLVLSTNVVLSQAATNTLGMTQEFAMLAAHGGSPTSFATFQSYSSPDVDGSQFFFPDWQKGEVVTKNKEVFNTRLLFVYDKVRQELFIRQKDSSLILLGNKEDINSFTLKDGYKEYNFVNSVFYSKIKPEVFYQVLVADSSKLTLLKYIKTSFVRADKTDMMKQREGKVYDAYIDKYTYYIVMGKGELQTVQLKTKSLKKTFADLNINPDHYLNEHTGVIDEDYVIDMVRQLNK